jgi:hypothetical protein
MTVRKYYNKVERLRQMARKVENLQYQINREAMSLLIEIQSNRVKVPEGFTWEQLIQDSKLTKETWNTIIERSKLR